MKQAFLRFLCGIMSVSTLMGYITPELAYAADTETPTFDADVNQDGKVNVADSNAILDIIGQSVGSLSAPDGYEAYDANSNGIIDPADALAVLQYVNGDRDSLPAPHGKQLEDLITLSCNDAVAFTHEETTIDLNIVDWTKDIAAYDFVFHTGTGLDAVSVECTGSGRSIIKGNTVRIFGIATDLERNRGKIASIQVAAKCAGDFPISLDMTNVYNSNLDFYESVDPTAIVTSYDVFAPVALQADGVSSKSVKLSWKMPYSDHPITGFGVFRDDVLIEDTVETSFFDTELEPGTEYTYSVCAYNTKGEQTERAYPITVTTSAPTIKTAKFPSNTISHANSNLSVTFNQPTMLSSLAVSMGEDGTAYSEVFELDGTTLSTHEEYLDISGLANGTYPVTITATDIDGESATYELTTTVMNDRPAALTLNAAASDEQISLAWNIASEPDVVKYYVYRQTAEDDELVRIQTIEGRNKLGFTDTKLDSTKEYTYGVTAVTSYDLEGTMSNLVTLQPNPDDTAPTITTFTPKNGSFCKQNVNVSITASDNSQVDHITCFISKDEGETWEELFTKKGSTGSFLINTKDYEDGVYHLKAMAYDAAGNESLDNNIVILRFDNSAPDVVQNIRIVELYPTTVTLAWDDVEAEDFNSFLVTLSDGKNAPKTYTVTQNLGITMNSLIPGTNYVVTVAVTDRSGNVGQASEVFSFLTPDDQTAPVITTIRVDTTVRNDQSYKVYLYASDESAISYYYFQYSQDQKSWRTVSGSRYELSFEPYNLIDGPVYIRAYAKDVYGNVGDPDDAVIFQITADSTPPQSVPTLTAEATPLLVKLSWTKIENEPNQRYILERATSSSFSDAKAIATYTYYNTYTDKNVVAGNTYYYRIAAVDAIGNIGAYSEPVVVQMEEDKTPPTIKNHLLSQAGIICETQLTFQVSASDNVRMKDITVSYAVDDSDEWIELTEELTPTSDGYSILCAVKLPETVLEAESVTFRVVASDSSDNTTEPQDFTYPVDNSKAEFSSAAAEYAEDKVTVTWECPDTTSVKSFQVVCAVDDDPAEMVQRNIPVVAGQTEYSCVDAILNKSGSYVYSIIATMNSGLLSMTETEPIDVIANPNPVLSVEVAQKLGAAYYFDATASTPAEDIVSIDIDYGDGTTDTATKVSASKFQHMYEAVGNYTVTLTCTNSNGVSKKLTRIVIVQDPTLLAPIRVQVKTTTGEPAAGVSVYMDVGTDHQTVYRTDSSGMVSFISTSGEHEIGVFGQNYLPVTQTVTLIAGAENEVNFSVVRDQLVDAKFEITRMTLSEIKAAGINVADPDNISLVKVNVNLVYASEDIMPSKEQIELYCDTKDGSVLLPKKMVSQGYTGAQIRYNYDNNGNVDKDEPIDAIMFMKIPVEAHALKEFFNVKMIVINNAEESFVLEDCSATLNVPEGLTIMEENSNPRTVKLSDIPGQGTAETNWILRGDEKGNYRISADFNATLAKFNQKISYTFKPDSLIYVLGASALDIDINVNPSIRNDKLYTEIVMKNHSGINVNMVGASIHDQQYILRDSNGGSQLVTATAKLVQSVFTGTDGIEKVLDGTPEQIDTLGPGQTFSLIYRIDGFDGDKNLKTLLSIAETLEAEFTGDAKVNVNIKPVSLVDVESIFYGIKFDPKTDYLFAIRNKARQELSNSKVTIYRYESGKKVVHATGTTDERGRLVVPRDDPEEGYFIEVTKDGYDRYYEADFHFTKTSRSKTIVMNGDFDVKEFHLSSAYAIDSKGGWTNILKNSYTFMKGVNEEIDLRVTAPGEVTKFEVIQDGSRLATEEADENGTATFHELKYTRFDPNEKVWIRAYMETGDSVDTMINIKVAEDPKRYDAAITESAKEALFEDNSITLEIPDNVEYIAGMEFNFSLPDFADMVECEITLTCTANEIEFEIAVNGTKAEDSVASPTSVSLDYFGNLINMATKSYNFDPFDEVWDINIGDCEGSLAIGAVLSGTLDIEAGSFHDMSGTIFAAFAFEGDVFSYPFVIPVVSVPGYIVMGLEMGLSFGITWDFKERPKFLLNPSISVSLTAALGVDDIIGVGLKGEIGANAELVFPPLEVQLFEISGALYLYVEVLEWDKDIPILQSTITLYSSDDAETGTVEVISPFFNRPLSSSELLQLGITEKQLAGIQSQAETPASTKPAVVWNGAMPEDGSLTKLETNGASASTPQLVSCGDTAMLVWVTRDASRGTYNAKHLVYSIYDKASKTWSDPKTVDDNKQAEYRPSVINTENGVYLAYTESAQVLSDDTALESVLNQNQHILRTARYDEETGKFTDFADIPQQSENSVLSSGQFLEGADGTLYYFYSETVVAEDETTSKSFCYTTLTENGWAKPTVVLKNASSLGSITPFNDTEGRPMVAYLSDSDGDIMTTNDIKLVVSDLTGTSYVLKEGALSALTYDTLPNGKNALIWLENNSLYCSDDFNASRTLYTQDYYIISGSYEIHGNQIFFNGTHENQTAFYAATYKADSNTFTPPVVIADMDNVTLSDPQLVTVDNQTLYTLGGISFIADQENPEIVTSTGCVAGGVLTEKTDVSLDYVTYFIENATVGEQLPFQLNITNNGTQPISALKASFVDLGDREYETQELEVNLLPGETGQFEYAPVIPEDFLSTQYSIRITPEYEDIKTDDNMVPLEFEATDLSIESYTEYDEDETYVTIVVTNNGKIATSASIIAENTTEETIRLISEEIEPGTAAVYTINAKELLGSAYRDIVSLCVESDIYDYQSKNNTDTVVLSQKGFHFEELGDLDFNGIINSDDSTLILKHYLSTMLEQESELTATQLSISDIDSNDTIDADDANYVLLYYVNTMIGSTDQSLSEFIEAYIKGGSAE